MFKFLKKRKKIYNQILSNKKSAFKQLFLPYVSIAGLGCAIFNKHIDICLVIVFYLFFYVIFHELGHILILEKNYVDYQIEVKFLNILIIPDRKKMDSINSKTRIKIAIAGSIFGLIYTIIIYLIFLIFDVFTWFKIIVIFDSIIELVNLTLLTDGRMIFKEIG